MKHFINYILALLALFSFSQAYGQSTDGTHSKQILPIAVDTASFKSRIQLTHSSIKGTSTVVSTVDAVYVPADNTAHANLGTLACLPTTLNPGASVTYVTLRDLCPNLAAGNNFGYLQFTRRSNRTVTAGNNSIFRGFAVFSRVSNPSGNGFSIEGFSESSFANYPQVVHGIRSLSATANTPRYQSNCFVSTFGDFPANGTIRLDLSNNFMQPPIATQTVTLGPNRMVRLLDVFATLGVTSEQEETAITATQTTSNSNAAFTLFCTVQDNTSFGADFRIGEHFTISTQRNQHRLRRSSQNIDDLANQFTLQPNSHHVYFFNFQNPDLVGCEITNSNGSALTSNPGLELYLRRSNNTLLGEEIPGAGGANTLLFSNVSTASAKASNRIETGHLLIVQSTTSGPNTAINYGVVCRSGSGHSKLRRVYSGSGRLIP
jgi:hypothetical protein